MAARCIGRALRKRSSAACMFGHQILGEKQAARIHAQSRQSQRIFLHGVALVLKQHHHHGDAQQHLRHRTKQAAGIAKHLHPRMLQLSHAHQHRPQGERNGEHLEGQRSALVAVHVEDCGAIEQNEQPDPCRAGWSAGHRAGRCRSRMCPRSVRLASVTPAAPTAASYQRKR